MKIINRVRNIFRSPVELPPDDQRTIAVLPEDGEKISIEMALNSRCTSDYDNDPKNFHWGMFDPQKKMSSEQIKKVIDLVNIPRFTSQRLDIRAEENILTFITEPGDSKIQNEWAMVESGMQQQAVGLICAALGVGMVFKSIRKSKISTSNPERAVMRIKLDPMKPSYDGSFWSDTAPHGKKPWLKGNLSDPIREGNKPLIRSLSKIRTENLNGRRATEKDIGQLIWAARGRTPHYYKSKPWGMTIPTNKGIQDISSVYLLSASELFRYVNWDKNRPTHFLLSLSQNQAPLIEGIQSKIFSKPRMIILGANDNSRVALWEVGYQLLNLFLQACSLDIQYSARLLDERHQTILKNCGIDFAVATFSI